jgi:hypothetical protein
VTLRRMRTWSLAAFAVVLALALPAAVSASGVGGPPVTKGPAEGYHSRGNHVACVLLLRYNRDGNAVRCGRTGSSKGRLVTWHGPSRQIKWRWPTKKSLHNNFYTAPVGQTLYLTGGTAKLTGTEAMLHCLFTARDHLRCVNGDGYGVEATRTAVKAVRISP